MLKDEMELKASGGTFKEISKTNFCSLKIPLPPLTVQKEIVERVEGYQRLIEGANQVVQTFKPNISFNPDWQMVKLGEILRTKSGTTPSRSRNDYFEGGHIAWVKTLDLNDSSIHTTDEKITQKALDETHLEILPKGTVLIAMYGGFNQIGRTGVLEIEAATNQAITALLPNEKVNPYFLNSILISSRDYWRQVANSTRKDPNITKGDILRFNIPLPSLEEQKQIVAQIEREQSLVNANRELITIYEQKIKDEINKLWEQ
jgi:restriction endonuclease S subunit